MHLGHTVCLLQKPQSMSHKFKVRHEIWQTSHLMSTQQLQGCTLCCNLYGTNRLFKHWNDKELEDSIIDFHITIFQMEETQGKINFSLGKPINNQAIIGIWKIVDPHYGKVTFSTYQTLIMSVQIFFPSKVHNKIQELHQKKNTEHKICQRNYSGLGNTELIYRYKSHWFCELYPAGYIRILLFYPGKKIDNDVSLTCHKTVVRL